MRAVYNKIIGNREERKAMNELTAFLKTRKKANLTIVAINVLVFVIFSIIGNTEDAQFMLAHGACYAPLVEEGEVYRLFTAMFLHFGVEHLIGNMLLLIFLGDTLERVVGPVRYLMIYLLGGLGGNVLSCYIAIRQKNYAVSAGASGALFAVIGALVYLVLRKKGDVEEISGKRLLLMAALSIAQGFTESGIDGYAHIGGFLCGVLLSVFVARCGKKDEKR